MSSSSPAHLETGEGRGTTTSTNTSSIDVDGLRIQQMQPPSLPPAFILQSQPLSFSPHQPHRGLLSFKEVLLHDEAWGFPPLPDWRFSRFRPPTTVEFEERGGWAGGGVLGYLCFRLVLALYWWFWLLTSSVGSIAKVRVPPLLLEYIPYGSLYLIYFTHWTAILEGIYLFFALLIVVLLLPWTMTTDAAPPPPSSNVLSWLSVVKKAVWALREVSLPSALLVTLLYWSLIFPMVRETDLTDVHLHLVNSVIMLLDLLLSPLPVFLVHSWLPLAYLLAYLTFSVIYWGLGGRNAQGKHYIYPPLDYDRPLVSALAVLATFLLIFPAIQVATWIISRTRHGRLRQCCGSGGSGGGGYGAAAGESMAVNQPRPHHTTTKATGSRVEKEDEEEGKCALGGILGRSSRNSHDSRQQQQPGLYSPLLMPSPSAPPTSST